MDKKDKDLTVTNNALTSFDELQTYLIGEKYIIAATSNNTRKTYRSVIRNFCKNGGKLPATPPDIANYLINNAETLNPRSLMLHLTALSNWHTLQQFSDPTKHPDIKKLMQGILKTHGRPRKQARVFTKQELVTMIKYLDMQEIAVNIRNKALILIGFFGAFRRNELVNLRINDINFTEQGLIIILPRSKTDQFGEGIRKSLPYLQENICPGKALKKWLKFAKINEGYIFRRINRWQQPCGNKPMSDTNVNNILKDIAKSANINDWQQISSHSMRRSLATNAYLTGASFSSIKRQGGWKTESTVWSYIEEVESLKDNPALKIFEQNEQ